MSPYELGRQPFGLAEPAAWLARAGFPVRCVDLAREQLAPDALAGAGLVAIHLPMHTATRIAVEALDRIRSLAAGAHLCVYGLYAPANAEYFRRLGVASVLGGEVEPDLVELAERLARGETGGLRRTRLEKIEFLAPARDGLPSLDGYASLVLPDGREEVAGFVEASRGCKHLCRHCPIVPVYGGRFRVVPVEVVLADATRQIERGARHLSFGDPDFLNGPTHARRVVQALHERHPGVTYDATIKVEHLLRHRELLPLLAETGCTFVITAAEAVEDAILEKLAKHHTAADFEEAVGVVRAAGIAIAPTFVAFTPWTTLGGYRALLERIAALALVHSVPPIQLAIRLLVPAGSRLLELAELEETLGPFDEALLGHPWRHPDPRVDRLQAAVMRCVEDAEQGGQSRPATFASIWRLTCEALGEPPAPPPRLRETDAPIPRHSEPWYCCAEPTAQQLESF